MMKGFHMTDAIEYRPLPIETEDFLRLKAAVGDRDPKLRLTLRRTEHGDFVSVTIKPIFRGEEIPIAIVERVELNPNLTEGRKRPVRDGSNVKIGWLVHGPELEGSGPEYEFVAVAEVANYLAFGDTQCCRRSSMKARRAHGAPANTAPSRGTIVTDAQGLWR
jgi:hypothetical protein